MSIANGTREKDERFKICREKPQNKLAATIEEKTIKILKPINLPVFIQI